MARTLTQDQVNSGKAAAVALLAAGMQVSFLPLALAQIAFETGGFNSRVMKVDNNLSGIKFINKPYQKNATQGTLSPEGNYYAHFASLNDWAVDYIRIISMGSNKPINATDTTGFASRLKANGYFQSSEAQYAAGMASYIAVMQSLIPDAKKKLIP